jgi:hypothetical protein
LAGLSWLFRIEIGQLRRRWRAIVRERRSAATRFRVFSFAADLLLVRAAVLTVDGFLAVMPALTIVADSQTSPKPFPSVSACEGSAIPTQLS